MNNNEIYLAVIGSLVRHFLGGAVAILGSYGVTEGMQGQLVEATVAIVIAVVGGAAVIGWSYLQKRFQIVLKQEALESEPSTPMGVVELKAAEVATGTKF